MRSHDRGDEAEDGGATDRPVSRRAVLVSGALTSSTIVAGTSADRAVAAAGRGRGDGADRAGESVVDREDPDPDTAVVLAELDLPIADWVVFGNETVADHNRRYDPDEPVVVVAFEHRLESAWPKWRRAKSEALLEGVVERGVKFHAFPGARLVDSPSKGSGNLEAGVSVVDHEDPDSNTAVVLGEPGVPIADWVVYGNETVADHNRRYDPDEPVVVVAFEERLESAWPEWRRGDPDTLFDGVVERGIKFHAFPRSRLERRRSGGS